MKEKRPGSGILLTLLVMSMLTSAFNIRPASAETIVVPDDYPTIQQAADAASPGDTVYVRAGTYYETVWVNKSLSLVGENRETTVINGSTQGRVRTVSAINVDNFSVTNFTIVSRIDYPFIGIALGGQNNSAFGNSVENCYYGIYLSSYSGYSVIGNNVRNCYYGIYLSAPKNNNIFGNTVAHNSYGIYGIISDLNSITENSVTDNTYYGIFLGSSSDNNTLAGNDVTNSLIGISLDASYSNFDSYNIVVENNVVGNEYGIDLSYSGHNSIVGNSITSNNARGIFLYGASDNSIISNNIAYNGIGLPLYFGSARNVVYHNNFAGNLVQASVEASCLNNTWNDGYPSGGNWWSDYGDVDLLSGPYQNESGSDCIWDHPYVIGTSNQDCYPLVDPLIQGGDLSITGIEPIQVIPTADALVAYKASAVKVTVESSFFARVWVEINVTYDFGKRWYLETGPYGNGVPIDPGLNRVYIPGGPVFSSVAFLESWQTSPSRFYWTTAGFDDYIVVELDPSNRIPEANKDNNLAVTEMRVVESKLLKILVVPVYFPLRIPPQFPYYPEPDDLLDQMDFLLGTYPVADNKLVVSYSDALPIWKMPPPGLLWNILDGDSWLYRNVAIPVTEMARNLGYDKAVIVIDDLGQPWSGLAWMYSLHETPNSIPIFVDNDSLRLEDLVAHEIGHTFSLWHPHDEVGPPIYDAYRFWTSKKDYESYSRTFMSYRHILPPGVPPDSAWIDKERFDSDSSLISWQGFWWRRWNLFDQLTTYSATTTMGVDSEVILMSGTLFDNNTAVIDRPWYRMLEGAADIVPGSSGNYSVVLLNNQGQMISQMGFNASFTNFREVNGTLTEVEVEESTFIFRIPFVTGVSVIEIRNASNQVLASRSVSLNPPTVNVSFPNSGEVLMAGTNYTITWEASDADEDQLTYIVAYSKDGGQNWVPLALDINEKSFVWNTSGLLSGGDYLVKVAATDGVNTAEDTSDSTFKVTIQGDINADYIVDARDLLILGKAFSSTQGSPDWNRDADINNDLIINATDLQALRKNFGKSAQ